MKEKRLSQEGKHKGKFAVLVDDEDYAYLNQKRWYAKKGKYTYYAANKSKSGVIYMHRLIMNVSSSLQVDHTDHNGLNNQKYNLRKCSNSENNKNKLPCGKSKYLGVSFAKRGNRTYIVSQIRCDGIYHYLGLFKTEELAALAYNEAAKKYHGEFANLNIIN